MFDFHSSCKALDAARDPNLRYYFVRTSSIERLSSFAKEESIAVGLKGIGKTGTYRYLVEYDKNPDVVLGINGDTHAVHLPATGLNYNTCRQQFELDMVIDALRAIHERRDKLNVPTQLLKDAEKYVETYKEQIKKYFKRVLGGGVSILGCGFNVAASAPSPVLVGIQRSIELDKASSILEAICDSGVKARIVVDDPELVFSATRTLDPQLIGGLCLASLRLSELSKNLKAICLMKSHVYYPVSREVEDLSKYPKHLARLSWDEQTLADMVVERLRQASDTSKEDTWQYLFASRKPRKGGRPPVLLRQMISRVRNGPRDLLHWLDLALAHSKAKKRPVIAQRDIEATWRDLSIHSLTEMERAHSLQYPKLGDVVRAVFRRASATKFTLPEFRRYLADLLVSDTEVRALSRLPWMQQETSTTLPERFFEAGALDFDLGGANTKPYDSKYLLENFLSADKVFLSSTLVPAITR